MGKAAGRGPFRRRHRVGVPTAPWQYWAEPFQVALSQGPGHHSHVKVTDRE